MRKKIAIDLDDVICEGGMIELVNKFLGKNYAIDDVNDYYMQSLIPKEKLQEWGVFFEKQNMYEKAYFTDCCYEVMKKLNDKYELFIITAYIFKDNILASSKILSDKFTWMYNNIDFINPKNYIFTDNKKVMNCDIRIDDKLINLEGDAEVKLLYTAYHNRDISDNELKKHGVIRVNGWKDIERILL